MGLKTLARKSFSAAGEQARHALEFVLRQNLKEHPGHVQLQHWEDADILPVGERRSVQDTREEKPKRQETLRGNPEEEDTIEHEPIPEGSGILAILKRKEDVHKASPEYIFERMRQLNPYEILCRLPKKRFHEQDSLPGRKHEHIRAPRAYTFRGIRYRLRPHGEGGMGSVFLGTASDEDINKHPDRPRHIIFKAVPREAERDAKTVQEIAILASLHPDRYAADDSVVRMIHFAGRTEEEADAFRKRGEEFEKAWVDLHGTRIKEGATPSPKDVGGGYHETPLQEERGSEAFPKFYEAIQYQVNSWRGIGMVMEYVEGEDYPEAANKARDTIRDVRDLQYFREVSAGLWELSTLAEALEAQHARGIVHRDLKPQNMVLSSDGRLRPIDYGIGLLPYFRGREELGKVFQRPYEKTLEYAKELYRILEAYGVGFDTERKRTDKMLTEEEEKELWQVMYEVTQVVYQAEYTDQERLQFLQNAFKQVESFYEKYKGRFALEVVSPLKGGDRSGFLMYKLDSMQKETTVVERQFVSDDIATGKIDMRLRVEELDPHETKSSGMTKGTPYYMAPEQITLAPVPPNERYKTDIFTLGLITMWRLRFGTIKSYGDDVQLQMLERLRHNDIVLPDADGRVSEPQRNLNKFLSKCLSFPPAERPTAREAKNELRKLSKEFQNHADFLQRVETAQILARRVAG